jgi:hypothetical protein
MADPAARADQERAALTSLALASLPDGAAVAARLKRSFPDFSPMGVGPALDVLTSALLSPPPHPPRLVVLDALVRVTGRSPGRLFGPEASTGVHQSLSALLGVLSQSAGSRARSGPPMGPTAGGPVTAPPPPPPRGQPLLEALINIQGEADLDLAWETFAAQTQALLGLGPGEMSKPQCDCSQVVARNGYDAQAVVTEFDTTASVDTMAPYADPRNWPKCSVFFLAMKEKTMNRTAGSNNWDGTFQEVVDFLGYPLVTPLGFTYQEDLTVHWVRSDYALLAPTSNFVVDEGFIEIKSPSPVGAGLTRVTVTKVIRWADPALQDWPSLACDLFWGELCIDMAVQCADGH